MGLENQYQGISEVFKSSVKSSNEKTASSKLKAFEKGLEAYMESRELPEEEEQCAFELLARMDLFDLQPK